MTLKILCKIDDIEVNGSGGFTIQKQEKLRSILTVRKQNGVFAYINSCPHIGSPLDLVKGRFLSKDRKHIMCSTHGALFRIENGFCISGPCKGAYLEPVETKIVNNKVLVLSN